MEQGCGAAGGARVPPSQAAQRNQVGRRSKCGFAEKPSAHANQSTGREGSVRIPKWKSADLYASPEPFASMWQKPLKSSIVEALRVGRQANTGPADISRAMAFLSTTGTVTNKHPCGPADSACAAEDSRPVMDGMARRFGLGASEHRDEVSGASITACQVHPETSVRWRLLGAPHEYANYRSSRLCNARRQQSNGRLFFSSGPTGTTRRR